MCHCIVIPYVALVQYLMDFVYSHRLRPAVLLSLLPSAAPGHFPYDATPEPERSKLRMTLILHDLRLLLPPFARPVLVCPPDLSRRIIQVFIGFIESIQSLLNIIDTQCIVRGRCRRYRAHKREDRCAARRVPFVLDMNGTRKEKRKERRKHKRLVAWGIERRHKGIRHKA